jgi:Resolvase, N terminal domain
MKTAIYLRVSTNRQTQAQTIEQQLERLRKHLELQGEVLLADNIFRDDGYSGANLNRPGLDRLRDRVKGGVLDRVLLTSPDRLARNYVQKLVGGRIGKVPSLWTCSTNLVGNGERYPLEHEVEVEVDRGVGTWRVGRA